MSEFMRETRYLVFKIKDIQESLTKDEQKLLAELGNKIEEYHTFRTGKFFNCVVVEDDWVEFEPTWKAIENRMNGVRQISGTFTIPNLEEQP